MEKIPQPLSQDKIDNFRKIVSELISLESDEDLSEVLEKIASFQKRLLAEYENAQDYAVYHVVSWGTPIPDHELIYQDFPGADSVEMFLEGLVNEYLI